MRQRTGNNHGYVMGWVSLVLLVMSILMLSILSMAARYHSSVLNRRCRLQAYETASSVAELVVSELTGPGEEQSGLAQAVKEALESQSSFPEFEVEGLGSDMGSCTVTLSYTEETKELIITAEAEYEGCQSVVEAVLYTGLKGEEMQWELGHYREGAVD